MLIMNIAEASKNRNVDFVKSLLEYTPDLIAKDLLEQTDNQYNGTALYWMCVNGEITMVTALLDRGADPNTSNSYRHTPLHAAADMEYVTIVKLLLKYGAKIDAQNQSGQTPLHLAAYRGYYEIVEILLKAGATHTIRNHRHLTALQESKAMNHIHTSELLHLRDALLDNHHSLSQGKKVELVRTRSNSPKLKQGVKACEETWSYFRLQSDKSPDSEVKCQRSEERPHLHSHKQFSRPIAGDRHPPRRRMMCQPTEHSDYSLVDKVL